MRDHLPHWVDNRPGASGHYYAITYYAITFYQMT
jgi:hypothetical protein